MQKYGKFGEIQVQLTKTWVEDAAPETHSHTSEWLGYQVSENAKKSN